MSNIFNITYMDGTTASVRPSLFDTMQAEKHVAATDGHTVEQEPVYGSAYATYAALRRTGQLAAGMDFDQWAQNVDSIEVTQTSNSSTTNGDLSDPLAPVGLTDPTAV